MSLLKTSTTGFTSATWTGSLVEPRTEKGDGAAPSCTKPPPAARSRPTSRSWNNCSSYLRAIISLYSGQAARDALAVV